MASNEPEKPVPATVVSSDAKLFTTRPREEAHNQKTATEKPLEPKAATSTQKQTTTTTTNKPKSPPPGYKLVKRRREDGTVVTMMRKMTPEELEAAGQTEVKPSAERDVQYKIVTVRNTDGSLIRVKRPIKPEEKAVRASTSMVTASAVASEPAVSAAPNTHGTDQTSPAIVSKVVSNDDVSRPAKPDTEKQQVTAEKSVHMAAALAEQKEYFRQSRMQKFRGSLMRGLGTALGTTVETTVGHMYFDDHHDSPHGGDHEIDHVRDGDIIDSDEDWTDDEQDDYHDEGHGTHNDSSSDMIHIDKAGASKTLIQGLAASAAGASSAPRKPNIPATAAGTQTSARKEDPKNGKPDYNVTIAALEESEKKAAQKDLERPLRRHWNNFAFYFMASLSIVLPLLFLLLALFVCLMNGKPVDSSWRVMPDIIKVGVSAWPIVFAAVVAQVFKGYATWKVERGIRLMQLEQLVGSNSFGNAVKQPIILRQLDTLSLILLLTWCLSPLGSQALQRTYTESDRPQTDNITISYLKQYGNNKVFSPSWHNKTSSDSHAKDNQFVAIQFLSSLRPTDVAKGFQLPSLQMDDYRHPYKFTNTSFTTDLPTKAPMAGLGLPIVLPEPVISIKDASSQNVPFEYMQFNILSSYFNFSCGSWGLQNRSDAVRASKYNWSASGTLGLNFTRKNNSSSINHATLASANINISQVGNSKDWVYSVIECDFSQVFFKANISCLRSTNQNPDSDEVYIDDSCFMGDPTILTPEEVQGNSYETILEDFSDDWTSMAGSLVNGNNYGNYSTPTELFLMAQSENFRMTQAAYSADHVSLIDESTRVNEFFGYLFNTWVSIGYCPDCQSIVWPSEKTSLGPDDIAQYADLTNQVRQYSIGQMFVRCDGWVVFFFICTALLLIAGIIGVIVESMTVAPDTLGYVSTVARNSRYLHLKPTSGAMNGPERARKLADTKVMIQDVKSGAGVGKIALGLKTDNAVKLRYDRLYR